MQRVDEVVNEPLFLLQEGAVVALARDTLRAPEVQVHGVAVRRGLLGGLEEEVRVVGAELDDEGAVERGVAVEPGFGCSLIGGGFRGVEVCAAVFLRVGEEARVEHRGVG